MTLKAPTLQAEWVRGALPFQYPGTLGGEHIVFLEGFFGHFSKLELLNLV